MVNAGKSAARGLRLFYYVAFGLLELVAAVEVTAMLVAAPRISAVLGIPGAHAGWILNAYLYPVFITLLLLLIRNGDWVKRIFSAWGIFITGLALFIAGNLFSALSSTPSLFFAGRIIQAVGGAMAYLGQLWTAMAYFKARLVTVMFWGECGLAIGVISGPMIGGYLGALGESGWRMIFALNAALALITIGFGLIGLLGRRSESAVGVKTEDARVRGSWYAIYWLLGLQWAVMAACVGGEFFLSNQLQLERGLSARFVGWVTSAASLGAVTGSGLVASRPRHIDSWLRFGLIAVMAALPAMGICLTWLPALWNIPPLFVLGVGMGMTSVSVYARIAEFTPDEGFVRVSILYLLAQQLGNAVGVQIVDAVAGMQSHPLAPALILLGPVVLICVLPRQRKAVERPVIEPLSGA